MNKVAFVGRSAERTSGNASLSEPVAPPAATTGNPAMFDALQVILRRRFFIFGFVAVVTGLALIWILSLPQTYMARTEVALLSNQANIVDLEAVVTGIGKDEEAIQTEIRILSSRRLAQKLRDRLAEQGLTDFWVEPPQTSSVRRLARSIVNGATGWTSALVGGDEPEADMAPAEQAQEAEAVAATEAVAEGTDPASDGLASLTDGLVREGADDKALNEFMKLFDVYRLGGARVVAIEVRTYHPEIAVILADGLAEAYIEDQLDARFEATTRATRWLNQRITALRDEVDLSERAVVNFMAETGVSDERSDELWIREISETNQQLAVARRTLSDIEQRLSVAQAGLDSGDINLAATELAAGPIDPGDTTTTGVGATGLDNTTLDPGVQSATLESLPEVISSRLIQQLRTDQIRLQRQASDLRQRLGARHPEVATVLAELRGVSAEISLEIQRIVRALEVQQRVATAEVDRLERRLIQLEAETSQAQQSQVTLRALQREADADRLMLQNFLTRFRETREQSEQELQVPDARIISYAGLPTNAAAPPTKVLAAASFVFSLGLALALAFAMESFETGYRMPSQIERKTGLSVLTQIPRSTDKLGRDGRKLIDHIKGSPRSAFAESVRQLYITLRLEDSGGSSSVMLTSSQSAEGKTTLAAALALVAAQSGQKVVLVEADLRRPRLKRVMKCKGEVGLADFLTGRSPIEDVVSSSDEHDVHVIPAGKVTKTTVETFDSKAMAALMAALHDEFDLVVVDAPPVLAVADALNISALVRRVVYVVQWSGTQREMVDTGLRRLSLA
ncbi:MAG: polysaccharide biosynthesis tyrosine autokinase, partial [Pseudomonadota bacterium]